MFTKSVLPLPILAPNQALLWLINWQALYCNGLATAEEHERAISIHHAEAKAQFLKCRLIARTILGHYLSLAPESVALSLVPNQKPVVLNPTQSISFNLAHSGPMLCFGISRSAEIGVDIESSQRDFNVQALAKKLKMPAESKEAVLTAFTAREALLKCTGQGLGQFQYPPANVLCWTSQARFYHMAVAVSEPCKIVCVTDEVQWGQYE
jgi:4'-phosphopantetheinyl transferase EntD